MGKLNKDNKGFGGIELLVVIAVVVILGLAGWLVYKHDHKTNSTVSSSTSSNIKDFIMEPTTKTKMTDAGPQSVIQFVDPSQITSNPAYIKILTDLHNGCKNPSESYIFAVSGTFNSANGTIIDGNYAELNFVGLCLAKSNTTRPDESQAYYIYKNASGIWVENQNVGDGPPSCSSVDGLGFPTSIIPTCFEPGGTDRPPTK
jgi:Tfp pilus assembly major pilin PilA